MKLKDCPFCGGEMEFSIGNTVMHVESISKTADGDKCPLNIATYEPIAWNTRPQGTRTEGIEASIGVARKRLVDTKSDAAAFELKCTIDTLEALL